MSADESPIRVAIVGGGCAAITTAFELTRPEHRGRYDVTVYQVGWRIGGKGASGRGPSDRIEEHGLHVWMGFYENSFRLLRECYAELDRDPATCPLADWRDAFQPDPHVGVMEESEDGSWQPWSAWFPPTEGLPGDPFDQSNPFSVGFYLSRSAELLRILFDAVQVRDDPGPPGLAGAPPREAAERLLRMGQLASVGALAQAASILESLVGQVSPATSNLVGRLIETLASNARDQIAQLTSRDPELRRLWIVMDLVLATMRGILGFGLINDPRGFDAIDDFDCREWLRINGASETSLQSGFLRGIYDLVFAYEDGDHERPRVAAGQAIRGSMRMFFTYRGAFFWKMQAGMGDVVFAPFYEVLRRRGVRFEFFHRLENVKLAEPATHVEALEFDVQARIRGGGEYQPLVDVKGVPSWPASPDWDQLADGERLREEKREFESFWDPRKVATRTLRVGDDFDFVVLGVGLGAVPHVCSELVAHDVRWRMMVDNVKTVATQALQLWMNVDVKELGWKREPITVTAFEKPFDTWADMRQLIEQESWPEACRAIAYFCSSIPDPARIPDRSDASYPARAREQVRRRAVEYLDHQVHRLWPAARGEDGRFRWDVLLDQFWVANVNPSDRYVLALPGTARFRISPLDSTYDNLTVAGDWTACGFSEGCVEAAVMSGRLAAHALSLQPALEEIIGYDHP